MYDRYWSEYTPESRTNAADRGQPWEIPRYAIYDLHVNYNLPIQSQKFDVSVFAHVFNIFDEVYVSDATDNSSFEAISSAPSHSAQRAEVFLGLPLSYNVGVKVKF
jgi:iron complex outermembrane receptor protein